MRKLFVLAMLIAVVATSCKKDDDPDPNDEIPPVSTINYYPMKVGNYWVYETYKIDSSGVETNEGKIDSIFVKSDTIVNGHTYYKLFGNRLGGSQYTQIGTYRDSSNLIVSIDGAILLHPTNFTDTLTTEVHMQDNMKIYSYYTIMENPSAQLTVPAGTFNVIRLMTDYIIYIHNPTYSRKHYKYYTDGIGMIQESFGFASQRYVNYERRLVRYHLN